MADNGVVRIMTALLKYQVKKLVGDEALGVIGEELADMGGDKFDEQLKGWLGQETTRSKLIDAANQAQDDFENNIGDPELKDLMRELGPGTLPKVLEVLDALPGAPDESQLESALREAIRRDWKNTSAAQQDRAVRVFMTSLRSALLPLEKQSLMVIGRAVLRTEDKVDLLLKLFEQYMAGLSGAEKPRLSALHQLPAPPADFVGRTDELEQLIRHERGTISGLSGLGGIGKTALGLVAAHRLAEKYSDAQFFLALRGSTREPLTAQQVMRQVILGFEPTLNLRDATDEQVRGLYLSLLSGKQALLFFDDARDAAQVRPLLPPPGCAALLTSRAHFRLEGMGEPLRLDVLPVPQAVQLLGELCARLEQYAPRIAALCGCLPLALKIAGTFLAEHHDWQPSEYIARLEKQRLQTLKTEDDPAEDVAAVFELSYARLSPAEQSGWRALGVFNAPFGRAALAAVCALDEETARDLAGKLLRLSLLEYDEQTERYRLHDLLGEFARSKLEANEESAARLRHGGFFMQVAYNAKELYKQGGENVLAGLKLFDREWLHIQAAQQWTAGQIESGAAELAMRLPDAGAYLLDLRLKPRELIGWLESALRAARFLKNREYEGVHLGNLGYAWYDLGETRKAIEFYEQHLAIAREIGDRRGQGNALGNLGLAWADLGETRKAIEFYEQHLVIAREIGDRRGEGNSLGSLGVAWADLGETRKAIEYHEQHLAIAREIGDRRGQGAALGNLGVAWADLGETRKAIEFYEQALVIDREIGNRRGQGADLGNLGNAWADLGETRKAIQFYEQYLAIAREIGNRRGQGNALGNLGLAWADLGETRKAIEFYEQRLVIAREIGDRRGEGTASYNLGLAWQKLGELERAKELGRKALEIYEAIESPNAERVREWLEKL